MAKKDIRFEVIHQEGNGLTGPQTSILLDHVTGVQYLLAQNGYGAGLCPLLDKDGRPVTWDV